MISMLINEIKERKMTSEQMSKFAMCCIEQANKYTNNECYFDCLIDAACKHFPHSNPDMLLGRNGMDEEKLAYVIVGYIAVLENENIEDGLDDIFTICKLEQSLFDRLKEQLSKKEAGAKWKPLK